MSDYEKELTGLFTDLKLDQHFVKPLLKLGELRGIKDPKVFLRTYIGEEMLMGWMGISFYLFDTYRDWKWPHWVYKQNNPNSEGFLSPQASLSGGNNVYADLTVLGLPEYEKECMVGPWGSITPGGTSSNFYMLPPEYHYCLDFWIYLDEEKSLLSIGEKGNIKQELLDGYLPIIKTTWDYKECTVIIESLLNNSGDIEVCFNNVIIINNGNSKLKGTLFPAIRPFGPIRFSPISKIEYDNKNSAFIIQNNLSIVLDKEPDSFSVSDLDNGDVCIQAETGNLDGRTNAEDDIGYCTGAAGYKFNIKAGQSDNYSLKMIPREINPDEQLISKIRDENYNTNKHEVIKFWKNTGSKVMSISIEDKKLNDMLKSSIIYLSILKDGQKITGGPGIYHGVWARDFGLTCRAFDTVGLHNYADDCLKYIPEMQSQEGYFGSTFHESGTEWDNNGILISSVGFHYRFTKDKDWLNSLYPCIINGIKFLKKLRDITKKEGKESLHYGLLTPSWSAEHFGWGIHNAYWDTIWGIRAFRETLYAAEELGKEDDINWLKAEAEDFAECFETSVNRVMKNNNFDFIPTNPYRKLDPAILGPLAALSPCNIFATDDERIKGTVKALYDHFMVDGGLFHDVMWKSYAPCLTHEIANNAALTGFRKEAIKSLNWLADISTPTHTWSEGVHPKTKSGSEGDSCTVFDHAEFIFMYRNMFVYEKEEDKKLLLLNCISTEWIKEGDFIKVEQAPTLYGKIGITVNLNLINQNYTINLKQDGSGPANGYILRIKELLDGKTIKNIVIDGNDSDSSTVPELSVKNGVKEIMINF